jgi:ribosomal protein S18 acetylase RimI-like enzyme
MDGGQSIARNSRITKMIIRPLQPADRMAIARIHTISWQQSYRSHMPVDFLDQELPAIMHKHWRDKDISSDDIVLVAEQDGAIAGFVAAWHDEPLYLDNLHVVERYRSGGIGRRLMGHCAHLGQIKGHKAIDLHVVIGNDRAKRLYLDLGGIVSATEDKPLAGIAVAHHRISWPDIGLLITHSKAE